MWKLLLETNKCFEVFVISRMHCVSYVVYYQNELWQACMVEMSCHTRQQSD